MFDRLISWIREILLRVVELVGNLIRVLTGRPPYLRHWLQRHPEVADAISWQRDYAGTAYHVTEAVRRPYLSWSSADRNSVQNWFDQSWHWLEEGGRIANAEAEGMPYPPDNLRNTSDGSSQPSTTVESSWAKEFHLRWVAFCLAIELGNHVPWSVTAYSEEELRILFDSGTSFVKHSSPGHNVSSSNPGHPNYVEREHNRGTTMPAPPRYTHSFVLDQGMIAPTRIETITRMLDWLSAHGHHYYGHFNYEETDNHWQYRGVPPLSRVLEGTTNPTIGAAPGTSGHFTAGCHGTTGVLRHVLRSVNIPVAITTVCLHSQAIFTTENRFLDHGDNPYNLTFRASGRPTLDLLLDEATYVDRFGALTVNREEGCDWIGAAAQA